MSEPTLMSWQACEAAARRLQGLFSTCYVRWEPAGSLRRRLEGDVVKHVVVPKPSRNQVAEQAIWERLSSLLAAGTLSMIDGTQPDPDHRMAAVSFNGVRHEIYLAQLENFGPRLVMHTGPEGYWRMLMWRLEFAGALCLYRGCVCVIDRSTEPVRYEVVPCGDERLFFHLARTRYRPPNERFSRPPGEKDDRENWPRGMLPEWYPAGTKVYVDPRQLHLFDCSKPVRNEFLRPPPRKTRPYPRRFR